ncbi:MAG: hypothetical protein ABEJ66_03645, partial [Candidatus Nanohaloarchaea archaeon]
MKKTALLVILALFISGLATAVKVNYQDVDVVYRDDDGQAPLTYAEDFAVNFKCDTSNNNCPPVHNTYVSICGVKGSLLGDKEGNIITYSKGVSSADVPTKFPCGYGSHQIEVSSSGTSYGTLPVPLKVGARNMKAHMGRYLYIKTDMVQTSGPGEGPGIDKVKNFYISNSPYKDDSYSRGTIFPIEYDPLLEDSIAVAEGRIGIHDWIGRGEEIGRLIKDGTLYAMGDAIKYNNSEFGSYTTSMVVPKEYTLGPDPVKKSVTPVHANGDLLPQGTLALAYEPQSQGGDGPYWHICREGNTGPSGSGKVIDTKPKKTGSTGLYKC